MPLSVGLSLLVVTLGGGWAAGKAQAQISSFQHVVVIVQENRTPDNLFHGLCYLPYGTKASCNTNPSASQYNIQTENWLDETSSTGTTPPTAVALDNDYDPDHSHAAFVLMCDKSTTGGCRMDGAAEEACGGTCPARAPFHYVDNPKGILDPYFNLATQYGFANYMFQTNQGPSFPAHQFLFGGTSAPSAPDDAAGTFVADNVSPETSTTVAGCIALETTLVKLITPRGDKEKIYPCLEHQTMADLLTGIGVTWKYYSPSAGSIWTAPNAIEHLCVPSAPYGGECTGSDWVNNVVLHPPQILTDISSCNLAGVSWVVPDGRNSDHAGSNAGGGPSWVASIVNAIGNNAKCDDNEVYWNNTAILVVWDDWGGWYDHEPPTFLPDPEGDYQYGFRVPLMVVSAYTPAGYINNRRLDFGSILRFIEKNYGITEGSLDFADARAEYDLSEFFNLSLVPRVFGTISSKRDAASFINDHSPATDPDDD
jgi:phospholipase C